MTKSADDRTGGLVYLACAVDKVKPGHYKKIVDEVMSSASKHGVRMALFMPGLAYFVPEGGSGSLTIQRNIRHVNEAALLSSDVLLVIYEPGVETWGTSQEVRLAGENGIPVFVVNTGVLSMNGDVSGLPMYLDQFTDVCFPSLDLAMVQIKYVLSGVEVEE